MFLLFKVDFSIREDNFASGGVGYSVVLSVSEKKVVEPSGSISVSFSLAGSISSIISITCKTTGSSLLSTLFMPNGVRSHKSLGVNNIA